MKFLFAMMSLFVLSACVSRPKSTKDLIRPWSQNLEKESPYGYPFVAIYKKVGFELRFIAVSHSSDINGPTFKTIQSEMAAFPADLLVIEPISYNRGVSPKFFQDYSLRCEISSYKKCGEPAYAVSLSIKQNIPFVGGEPPDTTILNYLKNFNYSDKDLIFFYTLRNIPQYKRQSRLNKNYKKQLQHTINNVSKRLNIKPKYTFEDFNAWYESKMGKKLNPFKIDTDEVAPYKDKHSSYTQVISHYISNFRDQFIVELLNQKSRQFKKILVIYGGSHHATQRLALESFFGPAKYKKLY